MALALSLTRSRSSPLSTRFLPTQGDDSETLFCDRPFVHCVSCRSVSFASAKVPRLHVGDESSVACPAHFPFPSLSRSCSFVGPDGPVHVPNPAHRSACWANHHSFKFPRQHGFLHQWVVLETSLAYPHTHAHFRSLQTRQESRPRWRPARGH